jgi:hypothetical protein
MQVDYTYCRHPRSERGLAVLTGGERLVEGARREQVIVRSVLSYRYYGYVSREGDFLLGRSPSTREGN